MRRKARKWSFYLSKELGQNRKVLAVILIAIGLSTGTNIFVNGLGAGFVNNIAGKIIYLTTSEILVEPGKNAKFIENLSLVENIIEQEPWVVGYSPRTLVPSIIHDNLSATDMSCNVIGIIPSKELKTTTLGGKIQSGRFLRDNDAGMALLGIGLAKELNKSGMVNYNITMVFPNGRTMDVLVVGVIQAHFGQIDDQSVFMIKWDIDGVLSLDNRAMTILIKTDNLENVHAYASELAKGLPDCKVTTWEEHADYLNDIKMTFSLVLGIVQLLSLIGAVVPVAAVLYTTILNKTKEIGIYKAIGASSGFILALFSMTCVIIGLSGILMGWIIGGSMILYFQAHPITLSSPGLQYEVSPAFDMGGMLSPSVMILVAIFIAGLYPAWKASRVQPMEAFRFG